MLIFITFSIFHFQYVEEGQGYITGRIRYLIKGSIIEGACDELHFDPNIAFYPCTNGKKFHLRLGGTQENLESQKKWCELKRTGTLTDQGENLREVQGFQKVWGGNALGAGFSANPG